MTSGEIDVQQMRDALLGISERQHAVMTRLNQSLALGTGMTSDQVRDLGMAVMEVSRSIKRAMKVAGLAVKEPI